MTLGVYDCWCDSDFLRFLSETIFYAVENFLIKMGYLKFIKNNYSHKPRRYDYI